MTVSEQAMRGQPFRRLWAWPQHEICVEAKSMWFVWRGMRPSHAGLLLRR